MMDDRAVRIHINPHIYSDDVWIGIPPKYWKEPALLEGLLEAIRMSLMKAHVSEREGGGELKDEVGDALKKLALLTPTE